MDDQPLWVFCSGLRRSGSTLQYQIAKTLVEGSGRGVGLGFCTPGKWPELVRSHGDAAGIRVVKCHRYLPGAASLLKAGNARAIFIHRDLRDVCVSWMEMGGHGFDEMLGPGFIGEVLEDDFHWSGLPNTLTSVYEDVLDDLPTEVDRIAEFLGIPVDAGEADRIAEKHSLDRQQRRIEAFDFARKGVRSGGRHVYDPATLLHHNHVRSGAPRQWEEALSPDEVERLEEATGDWLPAHGYALAGVDRTDPVFTAGERLRLRIRRLRADLAYRTYRRPQWLRDALRLAFLTRPLRAAAGSALRVLKSVEAARLLGRPLYALASRGHPPAPELSSARRILVIRLDRIGDVVLTLPMLRELRGNAPEAEITVVVRPGARELLADNPHVDRVLSPEPRRQRGPGRRLLKRGRVIRLAARHFWMRPPDLAIVPRLDKDIYRATFLAYFSGAARRVAYSERSSAAKAEGNAGYDLLLTDPLTAAGVEHEVERNLDMIRALGGTIRDDGLDLGLTTEARRSAEVILGEHEVEPDQRVVVLGVGAGHARRRWPIERFIEVGEWLVSEHDARVLVVGSPAEEWLGEELVARLGERAVNLAGRTGLREAGAVSERADLYIGNDTGAMHLAAAVGTPVVAISCHPRSGDPGHAQSPVRFGPWGVASRVLQPAVGLAPCGEACGAASAHCITQIGVDAVRGAAAEFLAGGGPGRSRPGVTLESHSQ